ncbi:MAG: hypothetical protein R2771_15620 [Saprospiraceae bacterium]
MNISYTYDDLITLTLTDYFFPGLNTGDKDKYFEYGSDETGHVFEGIIQYNGTEKIPVSLLFAMNIYGNDARKSDGSLFYSKYLELGYTKTISDSEINPFLGLSLDNPDETKGESSYYLNEKPGIINLGMALSKSVKITESFALPLHFSIITNPDLNKVYLVGGFSLSL